MFTKNARRGNRSGKPALQNMGQHSDGYFQDPSNQWRAHDLQTPRSAAIYESWAHLALLPSSTINHREFKSAAKSHANICATEQAMSISLEDLPIPQFEAMTLLDCKEEIFFPDNYVYLDWDRSLNFESKNDQHHNVEEGRIDVCSTECPLRRNVKGYDSRVLESGYQGSGSLQTSGTDHKSLILQVSKFESEFSPKSNVSNSQELLMHKARSIPRNIQPSIGVEDSSASSSASQRSGCSSIVQDPGELLVSQLSSTDLLGESSICKSLDENNWCLGIGSWTQQDDSGQLPDHSRLGEHPMILAVHYLPTGLYSDLDKQWLLNLTQCPGSANPTGPPPQQSCRSSSANYLVLGHAISQRTSLEKKTPDDESDDESPRRNSGPVLPSDPTVRDRLFACPFHQYDPSYFSCNDINGGTYRTCSGPGFNNISRVKEHLYRRHLEPIYCDRCGLIFKYRSDLSDHHREIPANGCEVRLKRGLMGITAEMKERLQSDKKRGVRDQGARWRDMYHMLFPDELLPSPYHDAHDALWSDQGDHNQLGGDDNNPASPQVVEFVRRVLDSSPQRLPQSRENLEAILISVVQKYQLDQLSTSILSPPPTAPHFNTDFNFGITPKASAPIWMPSDTPAASNLQTQNASMHQDGNHYQDALVWRPPVPPRTPSSARSNEFPANYNDDPHDRLSMTFTDPRSSDSGYSTNSLGGPGNYLGGFDAVESGGFGDCALPQDSQPNMYSRPVSSTGHGHTSTKVMSQNDYSLVSVPDTTEFPWDEYIDKSKFT